MWSIFLGDAPFLGGKVLKGKLGFRRMDPVFVVQLSCGIADLYGCCSTKKWCVFVLYM